jgi:hypothetical protein
LCDPLSHRPILAGWRPHPGSSTGASARLLTSYSLLCPCDNRPTPAKGLHDEPRRAV